MLIAHLYGLLLLFQGSNAASRKSSWQAVHALWLHQRCLQPHFGQHAGSPQPLGKGHCRCVRAQLQATGLCRANFPQSHSHLQIIPWPMTQGQMVSLWAPLVNILLLLRAPRKKTTFCAAPGGHRGFLAQTWGPRGAEILGRWPRVLDQGILSCDVDFANKEADGVERLVEEIFAHSSKGWMCTWPKGRSAVGTALMPPLLRLCWAAGRKHSSPGLSTAIQGRKRFLPFIQHGLFISGLAMFALELLQPLKHESKVFCENTESSRAARAAKRHGLEKRW